MPNQLISFYRFTQSFRFGIVVMGRKWVNWGQFSRRYSAVSSYGAVLQYRIKKLQKKPRQPLKYRSTMFNKIGLLCNFQFNGKLRGLVRLVLPPSVVLQSHCYSITNHHYRMMIYIISSLFWTPYYKLACSEITVLI